MMMPSVPAQAGSRDACHGPSRTSGQKMAAGTARIRENGFTRSRKNAMTTSEMCTTVRVAPGELVRRLSTRRSIACA